MEEYDGTTGSKKYDPNEDGPWEARDKKDDKEGFTDWFEQNDGNDLTGQFDHDNDGLSDHEDDDDDSDGIPDILES